MKWTLYNSAINVCILPMRDWNGGIGFRSPLSTQEFVSYLWGIETSNIRSSGSTIKMFVSYLWGIETIQEALQMGRYKPFVSYLWGIETSHNRFPLQQTGNVCILPMRDWNLKYWRDFLSWYFVCILPMRDWNHANILECPRTYGWFVSYLWGIETSFQVGNVGLVCLRLYLTYEGLKQRQFDEGSKRIKSGLYLTYEGLKLNWSPALSASSMAFVSYLWGIETLKRGWIGLIGLIVCILPMRDWN